MIVGTAGHIDHGKTTLVKALTGVDTDRLPEEKKRGISIELGYAFLPVPGSGERIGFIDVPGHERLVHTMLAGATGIDFALLLVAADDGPMPQTSEHLAVLSLLGVARGAAVITKTDRADAARMAAVRGEVRSLLAGSSLALAPLFEVSAAAGTGLGELRRHLLDAALALPAGADEGRAFRLAVDRAFTLDGVGTVITGTVHAGAVAAADELVLVPGGRRVRVRGLHAQNLAVQRAVAGQRCAVAVAGVAKDEVARGAWLAAPEVALQTTRLDAALTLWHAEPRALRSGAPVHVHLGAADALGTVAVLDAAQPDLVAPGETARVQIVLRVPVGAWQGDRVVLRDASASRTLAGGVVIDPHAPTRYRRTAARLAELDALAQPDVPARLRALVGVAPQGADLRRAAAAMGCADPERAARDAMPAGVVLASAGACLYGWSAARADEAKAAVLAALAAFHERHPDEAGPDAARLRRLALPRLPDALWHALLEGLLGAGRLQRSGSFVHLPEHGVRLSANEERIAQKVAPLLGQSGLEGRWVRDLARDSREHEALMRSTLARLAARGQVHQVVKDLYYPHATIVRLAALARDIAAREGGRVTAAMFRDATALGRKRAIQILEYFDRVGVSRRVGDLHKLRGDSALFAETATPR
jgi:selenocysteine-specific elongation factor